MEESLVWFFVCLFVRLKVSFFWRDSERNRRKHMQGYNETEPLQCGWVERHRKMAQLLSRSLLVFAKLQM